jgi:hypothetical protein
MLSELHGESWFQKVGKYTSKVTGAAAKAFLPSGLVDIAAKFDPSKKKGLAQAKMSAQDLLKPTPAPDSKLPAKPKPKMSLSPATIGIGVAALGALFLIGKRR